MPYHEVREIRDRLVEELEGWMGPEALADAMRIPPWLGNIQVDREKTACRADRRRVGREKRSVHRSVGASLLAC